VEKRRPAGEDETRSAIAPLNSTEVPMQKLPRTPASPETPLTTEQEVEAQRLADTLALKTRGELLQIARLLVSKMDRELLGQTEFQVRDLVHQIGAQALQAALDERKKGGTTGRA